jgi:hypothetical protein
MDGKHWQYIEKILEPLSIHCCSEQYPILHVLAGISGILLYGYTAIEHHVFPSADNVSIAIIFYFGDLLNRVYIFCPFHCQN